MLNRSYRRIGFYFLQRDTVGYRGYSWHVRIGSFFILVKSTDRAFLAYHLIPRRAILATIGWFATKLTLDRGNEAGWRGLAVDPSGSLQVHLRTPVLWLLTD